MPGPLDYLKNLFSSSTPDPALDSSMQQAFSQAQKEMPDVASVKLSSSSPSDFGSIMPANADAYTNPFTGNVSYNPEIMRQRTPDDAVGTMAHELTHSRQAQQTPWYQAAYNLLKPDVQVPAGIPKGDVLDKPYLWRPNELEAFQTERNRQMNQADPRDPVYGTRDINLPLSGLKNARTP